MLKLPHLRQERRQFQGKYSSKFYFSQIAEKNPSILPRLNSSSLRPFLVSVLTSREKILWRHLEDLLAFLQCQTWRDLIVRWLGKRTIMSPGKWTSLQIASFSSDHPMCQLFSSQAEMRGQEKVEHSSSQTCISKREVTPIWGTITLYFRGKARTSSLPIWYNFIYEEEWKTDIHN